MIRMSRTTTYLSALALILVLSAIVSSAGLRAAPDGAETITLPLGDGRSITLSRLIEFATDVLDVPLLYDECEIKEHRFQFTGEVKMPRERFQGYFERLLLNCGLCYVTTGEGDAMIHQIASIPVSNQRVHQSADGWSSRARHITVDELDAYADRGLLVTLFVPMKNLVGRSIIQTLNPYFMMNSNLESVRSQEEANGVILTTFAYKACKIARTIQRMDAIAETGEQNAYLVGRILKLETQVKKLEETLKTIQIARGKEN